MNRVMKLSDFKPLLLVLVLTVSLCLFNHLIISTEFFSSKYVLYTFSLQFIYTIFGLFSIVILAILFIINKRNKDIVGLTFLLLTSLKMGICGFIFSEIITSNNKNTTERINFFYIFILFLAIETLITIHLLNKKQQTKQ